jgi:hypothetical protein
MSRKHQSQSSPIPRVQAVWGKRPWIFCSSNTQQRYMQYWLGEQNPLKCTGTPTPTALWFLGYNIITQSVFLKTIFVWGYEQPFFLLLPVRYPVSWENW